MKQISDVYINSIYYNDLSYDSSYNSFCFQNCLKIILDNYNVINSWAYINSCVTMKYDKTLEVDVHDNVRSLIYPLLNSVSRREDDRNSLEVLMDNLSFISTNEVPIIVGVDTYYIPYATNFMKNHAKHTLILCGYDFNKKVVYVVDWYEPWFYKGEINIKDFLLARGSLNEDDGSLYSGDPIRNNWAFIDNNIKCMNPLDAVTIVFKDTIKLYYENNYKYIVKIQEDILININKKNGKEDLYGFYLALSNVSKRHIFFVGYLKNCFEKLGISCESLIMKQEIIVDTWNLLLVYLLKLIYTQSEKVKEKFAHVCKELLMHELDFSNLIMEFLSI